MENIIKVFVSKNTEQEVLMKYEFKFEHTCETCIEYKNCSLKAEPKCFFVGNIKANFNPLIIKSGILEDKKTTMMISEKNFKSVVKELEEFRRNMLKTNHF